MPVDQSETVDLLSLEEESGDVVLTVSDHLDWQDSTAHQQILQAKLNTYLAFVEGGQLLAEKPEATGRRITLTVVLKFPPDRDGQALLPAKHLAAWIDSTLYLALAEAPFPTDDPALNPEAGACLTCPRRTGLDTQLFADVQGDNCLDAICYRSKVAALVARETARDPGSHPDRILSLSARPTSEA